jgi:hypothetical protein
MGESKSMQRKKYARMEIVNRMLAFPSCISSKSRPFIILMMIPTKRMRFPARMASWSDGGSSFSLPGGAFTGFYFRLSKGASLAYMKGV